MVQVQKLANAIVSTTIYEMKLMIEIILKKLLFPETRKKILVSKYASIALVNSNAVGVQLRFSWK